ncbi:thiol peroxidase [Simkania sp.]|uniref:thiol peroxidase n=1 Tax=Simkania sp. TaxID=34094 RepID=UPI003B51B9AA
MITITLKGSPIHTNGSLPEVGTQAPDFLLISTDLKPKSLKDYAEKKLILSIVPSLDTPVCLTSAKQFEERLKIRNDIRVLFISADLPFAQKRTCGFEKLKKIETLSMMRDRKFAEDYGVLILDGPLQGISARAVLVLDENHQVLHTELVPEIAQEPDYEKAFTFFS